MGRKNTTRTDERCAKVLKAMVHPARLRILRVLRKGPACASIANRAVGLSQPNLSQHLKALREAGLVERRHEGTKRCYFLSKPALVDAVLCSFDLW